MGRPKGSRNKAKSDGEKVEGGHISRAEFERRKRVAAAEPTMKRPPASPLDVARTKCERLRVAVSAVATRLAQRGWPAEIAQSLTTAGALIGTACSEINELPADYRPPRGRVRKERKPFEAGSIVRIKARHAKRYPWLDGGTATIKRVVGGSLYVEIEDGTHSWLDWHHVEHAPPAKEAPAEEPRQATLPGVEPEAEQPQEEW